MSTAVAVGVVGLLLFLRFAIPVAAGVLLAIADVEEKKDEERREWE